MAVQVKSFSCALTLDTFTAGNSSMTILKNDFASTPVLQFPSGFGTGIARIYFDALVVDTMNCVFNFGFGFFISKTSEFVFRSLFFNLFLIFFIQYILDFLF